MQFATSEKASLQPSCKISIQDTEIITGSLGHHNFLNTAVKTSCLYQLYFLGYFMLNMASEKDSRNCAQIFAYRTRLSEGISRSLFEISSYNCGFVAQYGGQTYGQIFR